MTFYELLNKFPIEELWYILKHKHDLSSKPIKAERIFNLYKSAHMELISLHAESNCTDNILVCEFTIENDDGGAPESWIHCNMLSPDEDNDGKIQQYAMDFVPWNELIDCKVSDDSLSKLGELVCTAELLWEITFHGFSKDRVDNASEELRKLSNDVAETSPIHENDWQPDEKETSAEEDAIVEWITNAPEKVKHIVFGFYVADVCGKNEDIDDITMDEVLKRLKSVVDESSVDDALDENYHRLLWSMTTAINSLAILTNSMCL